MSAHPTHNAGAPACSLCARAAAATLAAPETVFSTGHAVAFMGHRSRRGRRVVLVVPRAHHATMAAVRGGSRFTFDELWNLAVSAAERLAFGSYRIVASTGRAAGQRAGHACIAVIEECEAVAPAGEATP